MSDDILPDLLSKIKKDFKERFDDDESIAFLLTQKNSFANANKFAKRVGELLAETLAEDIDASTLPDGKMYFNIAERLLNDVLGNNHKVITEFAESVQKKLNAEANINLAIMKPKINRDRVKGLVKRVSEDDNYDNVSWLLDTPITNFSQSVVDDFIKANVDFHAKTGLKPKLTRTVIGKCCKWCEEKAGTYDYPVPDEIYFRHRNCDCIVEYFPRDGRGIQNSHTKRWR